ncbi:MAG: prolipoprotein diacylglyceryl transferase [Oscillospiraceae bacterium]|jgi:phosphatidylglycerol:prolipoprotein diacylglycerol transferase|nr:prolipoprotein diacylglyceryl transferase [Oscillospiraceae bacterium]
MTEVYFKGLKHVFHVASTALDMRLFGHDIHIRWYGVIITFGFLLAVLFGGRMAYKWKMNLDKMIDVLIGGTIGGILGARLYYVVFHWESYRGNIVEVFRIWEGGLAIYGGLIGGLIAAAIVCKLRKLDFLKLLDVCSMSFLIGQGIGRWGNFTNQEAFGTNTNLPWGMWSEKTAEYINYNGREIAARGIHAVAGTLEAKAYVHPTFLYESLWCLLSFALIYLICRKWHKFSGQLMLCYGVLYGAERFFVEGMRLDSLYLGGSNLRVSQLVSAILVIICLAGLIILLLRQRKKEGNTVELA